MASARDRERPPSGLDILDWFLAALFLGAVLLLLVKIVIWIALMDPDLPAGIGLFVR